MDKEMENLSKIVSLQMGGYIILEFIVFFLIVAGVIPTKLPVQQTTTGTIFVDSFFIVIVGLVALLVAAFWLALLVYGNMVSLKEVNVEF